MTLVWKHEEELVFVLFLCIAFIIFELMYISMFVILVILKYEKTVLDIFLNIQEYFSQWFLCSFPFFYKSLPSMRLESDVNTDAVLCAVAPLAAEVRRKSMQMLEDVHSMPKFQWD